MTHTQLVKALAKNGDEIAAGLLGNEMHMVHMIMGIAGEVGELIIHLDEYPFTSRDEIIIEAGDLEFYIAGYHQGLQELGADVPVDYEYVITCGGVLDIGLGLVKAAAQLTDITKKWVVYHKALNAFAVNHELEHLHGYLGALYGRLGTTRTHVLNLNIAKLTKRYGKEYSDSAAIARVDTEHNP